jgi:hypothetical protein
MYTPLFETRAKTSVWHGTKEMAKSFSISAEVGGGFGLFSGSVSGRFSTVSSYYEDNYFAQRKISIVHYRLALDLQGEKCEDDFVEAYCKSLNALPLDYLDDPNAFLHHFSRWGVYYVHQVSIGGTLELNLHILESRSGEEKKWAVEAGEFHSFQQDESILLTK